jgi:hypothetical protein
MPGVVPAPFLFRFALPVRHVKGLPRESAPWLKLTDDCRIASPAGLDEGPVIAELRAAWNNDGLAISVEVSGKKFPPFCDPGDSNRSDGLRLWFDMRDTKTLHHGTRFCQHFVVMPAGSGKKGLEPTVVPLPVPRAREDAPLPEPEDVLAWSKIEKTGYVLEVWFPASTLNGFDPASQARLGFHYQVHDSELGDQNFTVGAPFPVMSDPSLWGTLVLEK